MSNHKNKILMVCMLGFSILSAAFGAEKSFHYKSALPFIQDDSVITNNCKANPKIFGEWVSTYFFDSTLSEKKLEPWLYSIFYGDIFLRIDSCYDVILDGNMDGGISYNTTIDSNIFTLTDIVCRPSFEYIDSADIIVEKIGHSDVVQNIFRRVRKTDNVDIIGDEEAFNRYFINNFFTEEYIPESFRKRIVCVWDGFRTYFPFKFNVIGVLNTDGEVEFYGWEFTKDKCLAIYKTKYFDKGYDQFGEYKITGLYKIFYKRNKGKPFTDPSQLKLHRY